MRSVKMFSEKVSYRKTGDRWEALTGVEPQPVADAINAWVAETQNIIVLTSLAVDQTWNKDHTEVTYIRSVLVTYMSLESFMTMEATARRATLQLADLETTDNGGVLSPPSPPDNPYIPGLEPHPDCPPMSRTDGPSPDIVIEPVGGPRIILVNGEKVDG